MRGNVFECGSGICTINPFTFKFWIETQLARAFAEPSRKHSLQFLLKAANVLRICWEAGHFLRESGKSLGEFNQLT